MSYKNPIAKTTRVGCVQVGSGLAITPSGILSVSGGSKAYGYFLDTTTQTTPVANTAMATTFNTPWTTNGVSMASGSRITFAIGGTYFISYTLQVDKTDGGLDTISVWLSQSGSNLANTTQESSMDNPPRVLVSGEYIATVTAGAYIQIMWSSADTAMRLLSTAAQTTPVRPLAPSARVAVIQL